MSSSAAMRMRALYACGLVPASAQESIQAFRSSSPHSKCSRGVGGLLCCARASPLPNFTAAALGCRR
eukprot:6188512-Pleurochrysis_carterae.AAC.2